MKKHSIGSWRALFLGIPLCFTAHSGPLQAESAMSLDAAPGLTAPSYSVGQQQLAPDFVARNKVPLETYTVQDGDSTWALLKKHKVEPTADALNLLSGLNPEKPSWSIIRPGEKIVLPSFTGPDWDTVVGDDGIVLVQDKWTRSGLSAASRDLAAARALAEMQSFSLDVTPDIAPLTVLAKAEADISRLDARRLQIGGEALAASDRSAKVMSDLVMAWGASAADPSSDQVMAFLSAAHSLGALSSAAGMDASVYHHLEVRPKRAGLEVPNLRIFAVPEAFFRLELTESAKFPLRTLSSPAHGTISLGEWCFWAEENGKQVSAMEYFDLTLPADPTTQIDLVLYP